MLDLAHTPKIDTHQTNDNGRLHSYSTGQIWPAIQEGMLQAIVQRAQLPKRTTREHWTVVADHLSKAGQHLGLPLRSPSSCWRKAARMGLIASKTHAGKEPGEPTIPPAAITHWSAQSSFAAPEIRALIADAFERACSAIVRELRGS